MSDTLPGTVSSDAQAFKQIAERFAAELAGLTRAIDFEAGPVPFWALLRISFPVAESIGDLLYGPTHKTAAALRLVLEQEFESVRSGYRGKAALLTLVLRHSLIHHDEPRRVCRDHQCITWHLDSDCDDSHLAVDWSRSGERLLIKFQPRAFCEDIVAVCRHLEARSHGGKVMARYNSWLTLELAGRTLNTNESCAADELDALWRSA